ncbi:S-methyl thiohydantoin desulfurase domain-containing protein [Cupriavidus basilensis]|uniref:S-methyl thiohydantoin desulfurase domain-containing protein n=1 Tax=Cupriavidus basilensis TaxID=68895 RepID=UPI00283E4D0B|nr:DUF917 family protein [Cupriavidus basilensis]MDR3382788.1 DUF917 family protein [Cupriavidus basilensis]
MKRQLTVDDVEAAVLGGAILGGGGGGLIEEGLRVARLALAAGVPELWSVDEFDPQAITTTVAIVGAPAAPLPCVRPAHLLRTLELIREHAGGRPLVALNSNENGAETTVNGWFHAAITGIPVMDLACNGRAHPSSVMGALGLHTEADYVSVQAFAGGAQARYLEGVVSGRLELTSALVRRASVEAGGVVAVARNPVTVSYAAAHGAPGAISHAIEVGRAFLSGGVDGAAAALGGRIVADGIVAEYRCEQREGLDVGHLVFDDTARTELRFINEYMTLEQHGERQSAFPNLIMTFDDDGQPVVSARVRQGMRLRVLVAPGERLLLSRTMNMRELYQPLEASLGTAFAPLEPAA